MKHQVRLNSLCAIFPPTPGLPGAGQRGRGVIRSGAKRNPPMSWTGNGPHHHQIKAKASRLQRSSIVILWEIALLVICLASHLHYS